MIVHGTFTSEVAPPAKPMLAFSLRTCAECQGVGGWSRKALSCVSATFTSLPGFSKQRGLCSWASAGGEGARRVSAEL